MDCEFCNTTEATYLRVPTVLGTVADLCGDCARCHGPKSKKYLPYHSTMPMGGTVDVNPYRSFDDDDQSNT